MPFTPPRYWKSGRPTDSAAALCNSHGYFKDSVGAQRPCSEFHQLDESLIQTIWSNASHPRIFSAMISFTFSTAFRVPLPWVSGFVSVAQFYCFMHACGSAGRYDSSAYGTIFQQYFNFYGRIASGIPGPLLLLHLQYKTCSVPPLKINDFHEIFRLEDLRRLPERRRFRPCS